MNSIIHKIIIPIAILGSLVNPKSYAQVLNYVTNIKIEEGEKITEKTFLIFVNDKESNWLSHIEVNHSPNQQFSLIEAKVIDPNGNAVRKLKKKDIVTKSNLSYGTFYQDNLIEEFELYWNEYPYQIEYSYRITEEEFINIARWYPLVYTNITTLHSSLQIEVPLEYEVSLDYSDNLQYEESTIEDKKFLKWNMGQFKAEKQEIYSPPLEELIPSVSVVPLKFYYGVQGSTESWASFGVWQAKLNSGTDQLPLSEKIVIDKLIKDVNDKQEIIKILYHYLQDKTIYINVAIDVGGLKSYPASYVCQNKYGDCKALTTYMKAMLKYADIESYYTKINAGANASKISKNFPGQQFNHVFLTVPLEHDTIWLENTSNSLPFNYLGTFTQDRYALMVNEEKSKLIRTPKLEVSDVLEKRIFDFDIDERGIWQVSISKDMKGEAFESYRFYKTQKSLNDQEEKVLDDISIDNFELSEWEIIDPKRDNQNINISIKGKCNSPIREIGGLKVIYPIQLEIPQFEEPQKRKLNVRINYPINKSDSIAYHIPSLGNFEIQLPENIELVSIYGRYSANYGLINSTLVIREYFLLKSGDYSIEEYPKFYSFINSINNHKKKSAIILK